MPWYPHNHDDRYVRQASQRWNNIIDSIEGMISAYDVAVAEGYTGTRAQWLASLKGDPGDPLAPGTLGKGEVLSSADGVTVSNFKPGRIDARVRGLSTEATAAANKTIFDALADEAGAGGHELWVPEGTYPLEDGRIESHVRLAGRGTLKAPDTATTQGVVRVLPGLADIEITGVTIDGSGKTCPVQVGTSSSGAPIEDVTIHDAVLKDTAATGGSNFASGVRAQRVRRIAVQRVRFEGCFRPMDFANVAHADISHNTAPSTGDNFLMIVWDANILDYGAACKVIGNSGTGIGRMGAELWSSAASQDVKNAIVAFNDFETTGVSMGVSVVTVREAQVIANILRAPNATAGNGIEAMTEALLIEGNAIYGFTNGMSLNALVRGRAVHNYIEGSDDAIHIANTGTGVRRLLIAQNLIYNPISRGVRARADATVAENGWHDIVENTVIRDIAYPGDEKRAFVAFPIGEQGGFSRWHRNRAVQGQASPTAGYTFKMFEYNGAAGGLKSSEFHGNILEDMSASLTSTMFDEVTGGAAADAELIGNKRINSAGAVSAVSAWS